MGSENIFVVCDRNVETLARSLAPGRPLLAIVADEEHKNMDTVLGICRWLLECGADRDAVVYAVGGGVTTDMAGFAASIYKRGVRYVNYPTTLLCQVDAGIGGKTGVNLDGYKNILGVINFPLETRILPQALETLPERELRSGAAEMLKTFIIKDGGNYRKAVEALSRDKVDTDELAPLIEAAAQVKREIVAQDPTEKGLRRVLNLGHTFAHAIEWYQHGHTRPAAAAADGRTSGRTGHENPAATRTVAASVAETAAETAAASAAASAAETAAETTASSAETAAASATTPAAASSAGSAAPYSHGEAVAIGIIQAARISEKLGIAAQGLAERLTEDFRACRLPVELPCRAQLLEQAIWKDKKAEHGIIHFVLIEDIGTVIIKDLDDLHLHTE